MKMFKLILNRFDANKFVRFKMSISVNLSDNGVLGFWGFGVLGF